ncbi:MAG: diguanylate cyclase [Treponema sp.]|nr:diguanylate cyclase [Treponema sp.]
MPPHSYKKPLGRSISTGCIVFVALLCLVLSLVNQAIYKRGLYARYEEHIRDLLTFVQSQIDTDDLANCIKTGEKSPKYLELQKFMDTFKDNVKLQYLYVIRPLGKNPPDNVMNIIAAMSSYEKEFMPEMEVELNGLTGEEYSIECVSEYLKAAEKKEISFFSDSWVKNGVVYIMYTGSLPIFTSSGEYIGLLCVDIDITEIRKVIKESTLTNIILILILGLTFITLFIIWAHYNIAKPIQKLENSVTTFAYQYKGKEDIDSLVIEDPNIHTNNEVESLANAVVKMSKDMRVYVENIIEAESKARTMSELANKDALTCVRNKTAYDNYAENVINKQIKEGVAEFAVAMVDLNHLKKINDTYGHEHGNDYIKMSCNVICHIFAHSPVFRIGGDEFVVILKGDDFKNRKKLLTEATDVFKNTSANESANPWERLSAAIGISDFNPQTDKSINDVFNRADEAMYANKVAMKAVREE